MPAQFARHNGDADATLATDSELAAAVATAAATYARRGDPPAARGMVCFTYDDIFTSHATAAAVHASLSQRVTLAAYSNAVGAAGRMTAAQLVAAAAAGHEVASHSVSHPHLVSDAPSPATRVTEYETSKTALEAILGAGQVTTWVYPYGDATGRDATLDSELHLRYDRIVATSGGSPGRTLLSDRGMSPISRYNWDGTTASHDRVLSLIRLAAVAPVVVTLYTHNIDAAGSATTAQLTEAATLASTLGVPCVPIREAFPTHAALVNAGFEDGLTGWDSTLVGTGAATTAADTPDTALSGANSLVLTSGDTSSTSSVSQTVPVTAGQSWTLSGRYRVAGISPGVGLSVYASIKQRNTISSTVLASTYTADLSSTAWAPFSATVTTDTNANAATVALLLETAAGTAYFDHVHFGETRNGILG